MSLFVPMPFVSAKKSYASALAAITNKTIYYDASSGGGVDGNLLSTTNFNNAGSAGGSGRSTNSYWRASRQNGLMGVEIGGAGQSIDTGSNPNQSVMNNAVGADKILTWFYVGKTPSTASNDYLIDGGGGYTNMLTVDTSVFYTKFGTSSLGVTAHSWGVGPTANVPFVAAGRVDAGGVLRINFNGTASNAATGVHTGAPDGGGVYRIKVGRTSSDFYECIISSDAVGDAAMDDMVTTLMTKWGI